MKRIVHVSSACLASLVCLVSCSSSSTTDAPLESGAPTSVSGAATPTDPVNSAAPTSSAAKDDIAEGTPSTESVVIEVNVDIDEMPVIASVNVGSPVTIRVVSAENHEFHLHGYDIELEGTDVKFEFTADQVGDFELEVHDTEEVILQLSVVAD